MKINVDLLSYNDKLKKRDTDTIDMIVLHCTELPTMTMCRQFGEKIRDENEQTGYCGHYYVDRDGKIYQYIEDNRIAYHVKKHNEKSMGIEIVNTGRYPDWFDSRNQTPAEEYTG
ncbi:MAG: N-acetylmuramoyl-L-alanine amidase, partial [bacterium]|nr:N-acetylmuramoyl-L-alanine amidase [bacterium]